MPKDNSQQPAASTSAQSPPRSLTSPQSRRNGQTTSTSGHQRLPHFSSRPGVLDFYSLPREVEPSSSSRQSSAVTLDPNMVRPSDTNSLSSEVDIVSPAKSAPAAIDDEEMLIIHVPKPAALSPHHRALSSTMLHQLAAHLDLDDDDERDMPGDFDHLASYLEHATGKRTSVQYDLDSIVAALGTEEKPAGGWTVSTDNLLSDRSVKSRAMHWINRRNDREFPVVVEHVTMERPQSRSNEDNQKTVEKLKQLRMFRPPTQEVDREAESLEKERSATWLELFYDIYYVAVIRILSHMETNTAEEIGKFVALFITVWWSWMMVTFYDTKYDTDDLYHRSVKLLQLFSIAGFAVSVEFALDSTLASNVYVISYACLRLTLLLNYTAVWYFSGRSQKQKQQFYEPQPFGESTNELVARSKKTARDAMPFMLTNAAAVALWLLSIVVLVEEQLYFRLIFWFISIMIDFGTNLYVARKGKNVPYRGSHLPERMGLLTIIVLGECVIVVLETAAYALPSVSKGSMAAKFSSAVSNMTAYVEPMAKASAMKAVDSPSSFYETLYLSFIFMSMAFLLWWIYFEDFTQSAESEGHGTTQNKPLFDRLRQVWIYIHLAIHTVHAFLGVVMVDVIEVTSKYRFSDRVEIDGVLYQAEGMNESFVATQLLVICGLIFILNGAIKVMHVYEQKDSLDRISYVSRFLLGIGILLTLLIPSSRFMSPYPVDKNIVSPVTWLSLALAVCCLVQVLIDIAIQYRKNARLRKFLSRSLTLSPRPKGGSSNSIKPSDSRSRSPTRRPPRPERISSLNISRPLPSERMTVA